MKLRFIFPESLNVAPGTWALLAIRVAELSQSLLFELSPPPLSSSPLTRPVSQANWPRGWRAVFTSGPLGADEPVEGKGCFDSPTISSVSKHGLLVLITVPCSVRSGPRLPFSYTQNSSEFIIGDLNNTGAGNGRKQEKLCEGWIFLCVMEVLRMFC